MFGCLCGIRENPKPVEDHHFSGNTLLARHRPQPQTIATAALQSKSPAAASTTLSNKQVEVATAAALSCPAAEKVQESFSAVLNHSPVAAGAAPPSVIGREKEIQIQVFRALHDPKTRPIDLFKQIPCSPGEQIFLFRVYDDLKEFAIPERDLFELAKFVKDSLPKEKYPEFIDKLRDDLVKIKDQSPRAQLRLHVKDRAVHITAQ